jgi:hypothetical protein
MVDSQAERHLVEFEAADLGIAPSLPRMNASSVGQSMFSMRNTVAPPSVVPVLPASTTGSIPPRESPL